MILLIHALISLQVWDHFVDISQAYDYSSVSEATPIMYINYIDHNWSHFCKQIIIKPSLREERGFEIISHAYMRCNYLYMLSIQKQLCHSAFVISEWMSN